MHPNLELLALLALGEHEAATPAERAHIESCPDCFAEVSELAHLAGVGRAANGSGELLTPAPHVWDRIQAEIAAYEAPVALPVSPLEPAAVVDDAPLPAVDELQTVRLSPRRRRGVLVTAIAAAVALIAGLAIGLGVGRLPGGSTVATGQLAALPDWSGSSGTARLQRDASGRRMLVVSLDTSRPLSGTQAVWLIDPAEPSQMRMLGYLDPTTGQWPVPDSIDVSKFNLVDVSEEPPNDPSPAHSGNSIVRGPLT